MVVPFHRGFAVAPSVAWLSEPCHILSPCCAGERFGLQSPPALPLDLADAKARQQRLLEAQRQLAAADAARRGEGIKTPAQLPTTDSDSTVLPNKEGGYAPN
jgi:hypothetical protein